MPPGVEGAASLKPATAETREGRSAPEAPVTSVDRVTPMGHEAAKLAVANFSSDLVAEYTRVAQRHHAEQASQAHVEMAAAHLYAGKRSDTAAKALITVGSTFVGLGGSWLASVLLSPPESPVALTMNVLISAAVFTTGAVGTTIGLMRSP